MIVIPGHMKVMPLLISSCMKVSGREKITLYITHSMSFCLSLFHIILRNPESLKYIKYLIRRLGINNEGPIFYSSET